LIHFYKRVLMMSEDWYVALLGLAESFRTANNINECVRCLKAIFSFNPPQDKVAKTHLQIGQVLFTKTTHLSAACGHLEQALHFSGQGAGGELQEIHWEVASLLARVHTKMGKPELARQVLERGVQGSSQAEYWHCRLRLQLAGAEAEAGEGEAAHATLQAGAEYCGRVGAAYTKALFLLSRVLLLLTERKFTDANPLLGQISPEIEAWVNTHSQELGQAMARQQKEYLGMFYLVLQVSYYLMVGQVKSVKSALKQLQQAIQTITAPNWPPDTDMMNGRPAARLLWMSKEQLCVLVYLVTVMHSMQAGFMEKAERYTDKAIVQIGKLASRQNAEQDTQLLNAFHVMLVEHMVQCRLVMGNKTKAVSELGTLARLVESSPGLLSGHTAQLHCLIGLYAMSINRMSEAEHQLNAALRNTKERELWTFCSLNLCIVLCRQGGREAELQQLLSRLTPDQLQASGTNNHATKAAAFYVHGLQAFFQQGYGESKRALRETLKMANAEDLNRLTSCSLVLLGHIFLSLGNRKEALNMVTPAMQLATKIPDCAVQLWAATILRDLHREGGDEQKFREGQAMADNFISAMEQDRNMASQQKEHSLIQWQGQGGQGPQAFLHSCK